MKSQTVITNAIVTLALWLCLSAQESFGTKPRPDNVKIHGGYSMEALARSLDYPTAIAFCSDKIWVCEAGVIDPSLPPKIKQIDSAGNVTTILSADMLPAGTFLGPLTDVTFHDGLLWVAHRQTGVNGWAVGAISKFNPANPVATFTTVIRNLPSSGDHYTEEIVFDSSGRLFFSQGSATNSSVVGADNWFVTLWLPLFPTFHDFAAVDIVLNGDAYQTVFPFPLDPTASLLTSPYMPFGTGPVTPGTVVHAATPGTPQEGIIAGNGAVYSFNPANPLATLHLQGWGFRNPYGIGIDPFNPTQLFVTNNGADTRGIETNGQFQIVESRPIDEDFDDLFTLNISGNVEFFGWPEFFHDPDSGEVLPVTDPEFCEELPPGLCPRFVFAEHFRNSLTVQPAFTELGYHTSANKFDFSTSAAFRFVGDVFVAETGSFVPITGAEELVGYEVVRVDRDSGRTQDFISHIHNTVDGIFQPEGFNKPIDVKFKNDAMFIVDFGVYEPGLNLQQNGTGKVWVVQHQGRGQGRDR
jgi:glucose/arabinose dehydrogenase